MASPGRPHTLVHVQNCMDAAEESAIARWEAQRARPLSPLLAEIVADGFRAAEASARLEKALSRLRS
jgi:hypothetical protein